MLKLYGYASSNYFNMVKFALLEKKIPFQSVLLHGCQSPAVMAISTRGKIPVLETSEGFLSETDVILTYLDEVYPQHKLLPHNPFDKARVKALAKEIELYIELPARTCYVEVFFGGRPTPLALKEKARRDLTKGFAALGQGAAFTPYIAGSTLSVADIYFLYSVDLARQVGLKLFKTDFLADLPGAQALLALLALNPNARKVAHDRAEDLPRFLAKLNGQGPGVGEPLPGQGACQREASNA